MYQDIYNQKKTTPIGAIKSNIQSGMKIGFGNAMSQPYDLMHALAQEIRETDLTRIELFYFHAEKSLGDTLLQYDLMNDITANTLFMTGEDRRLIRESAQYSNKKVINYIPNHFSQAIRLYEDVFKVDAFFMRVSKMDEYGYFSCGTNNDYSKTVGPKSKCLIVEVNENMPYVEGDSKIHIDDVSAIVESCTPLEKISIPNPTEVEEKIGQIITTLIPDRACLQVGIGALPTEVCAALINHKDLGVHTELLTPGLMMLIERGVVTNKYKNINTGKSVFAFSMGDSAEFYEKLNHHDGIESYPVDYVNDPGVIARIDNMISINSTVEMDLTGACNSEYINGHQYSATGGQVDFVRGSYLSKGGKSIIAFPSTTKQGTISKIVPKLSGTVTTPRTDVHYVVTEYGYVNLKGLNSRQRAEKLISLAHPDYRAMLTEAAQNMHLI